MNDKNIFDAASDILDEYNIINSKALCIFDDLIKEMLICTVALSKKLYSITLNITVASNGNHNVELNSMHSTLTEGGIHKKSSPWYSFSKNEPQLEKALMTSSIMMKMMKLISQGNLVQYGMTVSFSNGKLNYIRTVDSSMEEKIYAIIESIVIDNKLEDKTLAATIRKKM